MCKNHDNDHEHDRIADNNIEAIQEIFDKKDIPTTFLELEDGTENPELVAQLLECEPEQIIIASLFQTLNDGSLLLVLTNSTKNASENIIQTIVGERVSLQEQNVKPLGYKEEVEILIDADLVEYPELWASAGTPNIVFSIEGDELQYLTGGKLINLK